MRPATTKGETSSETEDFQTRDSLKLPDFLQGELLSCGMIRPDSSHDSPGIDRCQRLDNRRGQEEEYGKDGSDH